MLYTEMGIYGNRNIRKQEFTEIRMYGNMQKQTEMLISTPSCRNPCSTHTIHFARTVPFHFRPHTQIDTDTKLYSTALYDTILHYTILHYTILYYTILYHTTLHYTILYYTVHTHTYCTALSCIVRTSMHSCWHQEFELVRPVERIRPGVSVMGERERDRGRRDRAKGGRGERVMEREGETKWQRRVYRVHHSIL
jgi:hypothetical protein